MPDPKKAEQDRLKANVARRQQDTNRSTSTTTFTPNEAKMAAERTFSWGGGVAQPAFPQAAGPKIGAAPYAPAPQMRPMTAGEQVDYAGRRVGEAVDKATRPAQMIMQSPAAQVVNNPIGLARNIGNTQLGLEATPDQAYWLDQAEGVADLLPTATGLAKGIAKGFGKQAVKAETKSAIAAALPKGSKTGPTLGSTKPKAVNTRNMMGTAREPYVFNPGTPEQQALVKDLQAEWTKKEGQPWDNFAGAREGAQEGRKQLTPVQKNAEARKVWKNKDGSINTSVNSKAEIKAYENVQKKDATNRAKSNKGSGEPKKGTPTVIKKPKTASELQAADREREARMRSLEDKQMAGKAFAQRGGRAMQSTFDKVAGNMRTDQSVQHGRKARASSPVAQRAKGNEALASAATNNREGSASELNPPKEDSRNAYNQKFTIGTDARSQKLARSVDPKYGKKKFTPAENKAQQQQAKAYKANEKEINRVATKVGKKK